MSGKQLVIHWYIFCHLVVKKMAGMVHFSGRNHLENNLSKKDLESYELNVYEWSSDVGEFKDNVQGNSDSNSK